MSARINDAEASIAGAIDLLRKHKPKTELEGELLAPVIGMLTDALTHLQRVPAVIETRAKAQAIQDAQRALDAAQAAQQG